MERGADLRPVPGPWSGSLRQDRGRDRRPGLSQLLQPPGVYVALCHAGPPPAQLRALGPHPILPASVHTAGGLPGPSSPGIRYVDIHPQGRVRPPGLDGGEADVRRRTQAQGEAHPMAAHRRRAAARGDVRHRAGRGGDDTFPAALVARALPALAQRPVVREDDVPRGAPVGGGGWERPRGRGRRIQDCGRRRGTRGC